MDEKVKEKRWCPGNSPYCLGLLEWDCCGTQGLLESLQGADSVSPTSKSECTVNFDDKTTKPMAKKQKVSLQLHKDKKKYASHTSCSIYKGPTFLICLRPPQFSWRP